MKKLIDPPLSLSLAFFSHLRVLRHSLSGSSLLRRVRCTREREGDSENPAECDEEFGNWDYIGTIGRQRDWQAMGESKFAKERGNRRPATVGELFCGYWKRINRSTLVLDGAGDVPSLSRYRFGRKFYSE